ncbi:MAG: hypothetical protein C0436_00305 [Alphaproteobacteria bacterium]|nr:hypothetical protein [Alphaproteobacteria bacterium]
MILLQADDVHGVFEVTSFDDGYTLVDDVDFIGSLSEKGYTGPVACATSNANIVAELESEYGIFRLKA